MLDFIISWFIFFMDHGNLYDTYGCRQFLRRYSWKFTSLSAWPFLFCWRPFCSIWIWVVGRSCAEKGIHFTLTSITRIQLNGCGCLTTRRVKVFMFRFCMFPDVVVLKNLVTNCATNFIAYGLCHCIRYQSPANNFLHEYCLYFSTLCLLWMSVISGSVCISGSAIRFTRKLAR